MAWYDNDSLLTKGLGPYLSTIIITAIITLLLPILLHVFLYRVRKPTRLPSFLVLGPSGVGKTSLVVNVLNSLSKRQ
jgi:signal recognition particle receptor subunit beta